jgi:hypothetical protein
VALYPLRSCEVVFQYLASRAPFDDIQMRKEFRLRLNKIPGVELPASKIELRPSFPLSVLADTGRWDSSSRRWTGFSSRRCGAEGGRPQPLASQSLSSLSTGMARYAHVRTPAPAGRLASCSTS